LGLKLGGTWASGAHIDFIRGGVAVKQLCEDVRQFAIEVRQLGYSVDGGLAERECLDLSERMLAAVRRTEERAEPARR
jgi:hypothetical protein